MKNRNRLQVSFRIYYPKKVCYHWKWGRVCGLELNLTIEYGIKSYVVSDGGAVSRTSPKIRDDPQGER